MIDPNRINHYPETSAVTSQSAIEKHSHHVSYQNRQRIKQPDAGSFAEAVADFGCRVFTTFIAQQVPTPGKPTFALFLLEKHLERLLENAQFLGLDLEPHLECHQASLQQWVINELVLYFRSIRIVSQSYLIRLVIGENGLDIFIAPFQQRWTSCNGIRACSVQVERNLPLLKTVAAVASVYARKLARAKNVEEAILIDRDGLVREGAWSNVFWFDHAGLLHTVGTKILPGITRHAVLALTPGKLTDISRDNLLHSASEVFVTQSTTGITPVVEIDGIPIGSGTVGPQCQALQDAFIKYFNRHLTILDLEHDGKE